MTRQPVQSSAISCSLNNVHQTVAAVASVTADGDMWKIMELPNSHGPQQNNPVESSHSCDKSNGSLSPTQMPRTNLSPKSTRHCSPQSPTIRENVGFVFDDDTSIYSIYRTPTSLRQYLSTELPFHSDSMSEPEDGLQLNHLRRQREYSSDIDLPNGNIYASTEIDSVLDRNETGGCRDNPIFSIEETGSGCNLRERRKSTSGNNTKKCKRKGKQTHPVWPPDVGEADIRQIQGRSTRDCSPGLKHTGLDHS